MSETEKISDLDKVLSKFSIFGRYHMFYILCSLIAMSTNEIYASNYIFMVHQVGYSCKDESFGNDTCKSVNDGTEHCNEWVYHDPYSFVAEFDLACQEWKRTLIGTLHSFGYMVGLLFVGPMSDRWGRKISIVLTGMLGGVFGLSRSFTTAYWMYGLLEFLEGAIGDICSPIFILTIEMVASKSRILYFLLCSMGYPLGGILLATASWRFTYWRTCLRVIYTPAFFFFAYLYLIDESPRWLLIKGRKEEAVAIVEKAANRSKVKIDKATLEKLECERETKVGLINLLKMTFESKIILQRFLVCVCWWITCTFVNYGLSINSVSLQGSKYVNYALTTLMDFPANVITFFIVNRFKRKLSLMGSFFAGAALCLSQPFVPNHLPWLSLVFYLAGKMMSSFYFSITYIYTSELFPTYTRNSMHALCSSIGRIGSIIAPQTPLLIQYWYGLPSLVFGGMSLLAGLITFLVPDTADNSLPDTIRQAEEIGKPKPVDSSNEKYLQEIFTTSKI